MKRLIAALLVISAATLTATGCCPLLEQADTQTTQTGSTRGGIGGAVSLEQFLDADTKTGDYTFVTTYADGETWEGSGEFWVDGDLFRYDLYQDGEMIRSILTPDGETAYFAEVSDQTARPSVAGVEYYLAEYRNPGEDSYEDGIDEESGATRVVYTMQKTYTVPGSANSWYVEDITYLVKDGAVIGVISRGCVPEDDGTIGPLDSSRKLYSNVRAGVTIDPETFELPYPVQEAE